MRNLLLTAAALPSILGMAPMAIAADAQTPFTDDGHTRIINERGEPLPGEQAVADSAHVPGAGVVVKSTPASGSRGKIHERCCHGRIASSESQRPTSTPPRRRARSRTGAAQIY